MRRFYLSILFLSLLFGFTSSCSAQTVIRLKENSKDCVILLHGLARTSRSMEEMAAGLWRKGYSAINVDYPSREFTVEELADTHIPPAVHKCRETSTSHIHFVTHSMGGILVRYYLKNNDLPELGRVVMLSPPNQGSEVVDKLKDTPGFFALNGPAGLQLGTDTDSTPLKLGRVDFELGIITGNASINLILSQLIPGDDDGKVSVERAKVEGMKDFLVVDHSHPLIMTFADVIEQTVYFLQNGRFKVDKEE